MSSFIDCSAIFLWWELGGAAFLHIMVQSPKFHQYIGGTPGTVLVAPLLMVQPHAPK
jgi:hypothetical protein